MKTFQSAALLIFIAATTLDFPCAAQSPVLISGPRGPHQEVWRQVHTATNGVALAVSQTNHAFVEIATGLAYFDTATGQLERSVEEFVVAVDGAFVANKAQHRLRLASNLNATNAVQLTLPGGTQLISQPIFLALKDSVTGTNVLIAEVKDCTGELASSNTVVFADAFTDIRGSVRYTFTKAGMAQDVILYDNIDPSEWGLTNTEVVTLDMYSEFASTLTPQLRTNIVEGWTDQTLDFPGMRIGSGRGFLIGEPEDSVPVLKTYQVIEGRRFLIESVPYSAAASFLDELPPPGTGGTARRPVSNRAGLLAQLRGNIPAKPVARIDAKEWAGKRGFIIDYETILSTHSNQTFRGDFTYFISANAFLEGTQSVFESGTVLKYADNVALRINTPVNWQATHYRPVVMASKNDTSVGENTAGSGNPGPDRFARAALYFDAVTANTNLVLRNLKVSNAKTAVVINGGAGHVLSHVQLVSCHAGIATTNTDFALRNALLVTVLTNFTGSTSTGRVEHLTCNVANWFNDSGTNLFVTNSLLVAVTNLGSCTTQNVIGASSGAAIFQTVGAGSHYLIADSPHRNAGTTAINAALAEDIKQLTTYPPIVYSNVTFALDTVFGPQASRDTDLPDLGWHYCPLDWAFGGVTADANLTFNAGTAVGWFEWSGASHGISVTAGETNFFQGTAEAPCTFARYSTVQEGNGLWTAKGTLAGVTSSGSGTARVIARFTRFAALANDPNHVRDNGGLLFNQANHCEYWNGNLGGFAIAHAMTNCLFDRVIEVGGAFEGDYSFSLRNCTMHGRIVYIIHPVSSTKPVWIENCAFDGSTTEMDDYSGGNTAITYCDYNTFLNGADLLAVSGTHDIQTNMTWQAGPLGNFYQPTNNFLMNTGSVTADVIGFFHFTTQTNQAKETNSIVDRAYHYVSLNSQPSTLNPLDTDGDGTPDYEEDTNGNGSVNSGETDWQSATDIGLRVFITRPKNNSTIP